MMPPLKPVVNTRYRFINIPRINDKCSYITWLRALLDNAHNKGVLVRSEEGLVDKLYQSQATKQFSLSKTMFKSAMERVSIALSTCCKYAEPSPDEFQEWQRNLRENPGQHQGSIPKV